MIAVYLQLYERLSAANKHGSIVAVGVVEQ